MSTYQPWFFKQSHDHPDEKQKTKEAQDVDVIYLKEAVADQVCYKTHTIMQINLFTS